MWYRRPSTVHTDSLLSSKEDVQALTGDMRQWSSTDSSGYSTDGSSRLRVNVTKASSFHGSVTLLSRADSAAKTGESLSVCLSVCLFHSSVTLLSRADSATARTGESVCLSVPQQCHSAQSRLQRRQDWWVSVCLSVCSTAVSLCSVAPTAPPRLVSLCLSVCLSVPQQCHSAQSRRQCRRQDWWVSLSVCLFHQHLNGPSLTCTYDCRYCGSDSASAASNMSSPGMLHQHTASVRVCVLQLVL